MPPDGGTGASVASLGGVAHWLKRTKDQIADRVAWPEGSVADQESSGEDEGHEPPEPALPSGPLGPRDSAAEGAGPARQESDPQD